MGEQEQPPEWAQALLNASKDQGEAIEDIGESLSDFKGQTVSNFTQMGTQLGFLKERATEDREKAERKESEIESKVGVVHERTNEVNTKADVLKGKFDNHVEDDHATETAKTKAALAGHIKDPNRHSGVSPQEGQGVHPAIKYSGAGVGGGGLLLVLYKVLETFTQG